MDVSKEPLWPQKDTIFKKSSIFTLNGQKVAVIGYISKETTWFVFILYDFDMSRKSPKISLLSSTWNIREKEQCHIIRDIKDRNLSAELADIKPSYCSNHLIKCVTDCLEAHIILDMSLHSKTKFELAPPFLNSF